ncbi:MAG: hypothetical protein ACOCS7_02215 [Halolamina sp.]
MDRHVWWGLALFGVTALLLTTGLSGQSPAVERPPDPSGTYELEDGNRLWPYTSTRLDVSGRTLPINVFVPTSPERTSAMLAGGPGDWKTDEPAADAETYSVGRWGKAAGADRFTARVPAAADPVWMSETAQLADGHYLGEREHVRIYGPENGEWSALQAHGEHWDWFRLRHSVDDLENARDGVTAALAARTDAPVEDREEPPRRVVLVAGVALLLAGRRRLGGSVTAAMWPGALYLGVRATGIALESALPWAPPKAIVVVLYPFVVLGIPLAAYYAVTRRAGETGPRTAFVLTAGAFALALFLDALAMGVTAPSVRLLVFRSVAVVAVGLLAAAGTSDGPSRGPGLLVWSFAVLLPLTGGV